MATIQKYLTQNTDYMVGIITQNQGKFVFGAQVNGWKQNEAGQYLVPFDVVMFRAKREETMIEAAKRIALEEIGANIELINLRGNQVGILTDLTFLFDGFEGQGTNPAYIRIFKKATSSKVNAEAYINHFIYSAKAEEINFKSANMQALFCTPPALLRKIMTGKLTVGEAKAEGLVIADPKVEIPDDSIFIPQNNTIEFIRFMRESSK